MSSQLHGKHLRGPWTPRRTWRGWAHLAGAMLALAIITPSRGQEPVREYRSTHFHVTTDLAGPDARALLDRMEQVLSLAERYWRRALPGQIRGYVVGDLSHWAGDDFPVDHAREVLRQVRGGTDLPDPNHPGRRSRKAVIYAMAEPGVAEHEVVHAYCFQTFGQGGPDWYREGMAELLAQEAAQPSIGPIRPDTIRRLRQTSTPTIYGVTRSGTLTDSLSDILAPSPGTDAGLSENGDHHWPVTAPNRLGRARTAYAQSWALCHLLYHNHNYQARFQLLGQHLLSGAQVQLEDAFAGCLDEIDFELAQFTEKLTKGYRVDLCDWNWDGDYRELEIGQSVTIRLRARRGFQPTRVLLLAGHIYRIDAHGSWWLQVDADPLDADGNAEGHGRLEAVVLHEFNLAAPVGLGKQSTLTAAQDGRLFLRCRDAWGELADNRGTIAVRLTRTH